jgi:hypothetical protein
LKCDAPPAVRQIICSSCKKKYHENCILWLHDIDAEHVLGKDFICPACSANASLKWPPKEVSNNRGAFYKAGSVLEATDDAQSQWHKAECVLVGIQRIMVHYVGFSHEHNQWLDPELELLRPSPRRIETKRRRKASQQMPKPNGSMDDQIAKKWLNIAWEKGVLQEAEYHEPLSVLTGWQPSKIQRFCSDKKFQAKRAGNNIPTLYIPKEDAPLNEDTRALLRYVYNHGLLETKDYFDAWSALSGLTVGKLRRWISDHKYALKKKAQNNEHVQQRKRPPLSQTQEHIVSHLALQDLQEGDYEMIASLTGVTLAHIYEAIDYYRR